jgi:ABC-2 type transport system permease protein
VVGRRAALRSVRSGVVWGYLFGAVVASSAVSYSSLYKTPTERHRLAAAFSSNNAGAALFGPARQLQTVAGFTVFKTSMTLMILGAVWGLLTSTRLLRGEEEAGRTELLLCGQTTRRGAAAQTLAGLGCGVVSLWGVTALITALTGLSSRVDIAVGPALYLALALVSAAAMFLGVGALTSQLAATRRQAASYGAVFLGVGYAMRMVADAGIGLHGLIWASPLGWVEQLQPLTGPSPLALVPIVGFTAAVSVVAVMLAGARDVGASTLPDEATSAPHLRLLSGPTGVAWRIVRPGVFSWWLAIAATGLLTGAVAKSAGATIAGSSVQQVFTKLGARGTGTDTFLGVSFLIAAVLVACMAAALVTAARGEESAGRLDAILVRPVSRTSWLGGRLLLATVVLVAGGGIVGVCTWVATASQHAGVSLGSALGAGLNVVPPALCILGLGALAMGVIPRAAAAVTYGVVGWSLLVEIVGGIGTPGRWLLDTSLFHQMASAPAVAVNAETNSAMVAIAVVSAGLGIVAFRRRDLRGA